LGGGLAGLTLARQLRRAHGEMSILVVEKQAYPVPEAAYKVGESTVELGSYYLRDVLGLAEHLETSQLFKAGLRYYFPAGDKRDITRRVEMGGTIIPPIRSHQIDRGRFENMLWTQNQQDQIECWDNCTVRAIDLQESGHTVTVAHNDETEIINARWVVDSAGRAGLLKRHLSLAQEVDHRAGAVWFRIEDKINIDDWSNDSSWRGRVPTGIRWLGTNHLMDRGYWVWLIPLAGDVTSVGIVADSKIHPHQTMNRFDRALDWLKLHEPQCAVAVQERQHLLQDFRVLKQYPHSCQRVYSSQRWAITGEAGVFSDPFYSPGTDFISMSNSLVTDLILRDLRGEAIGTRVEFYNQSYLSTFQSFLSTYTNQYALMGNAEVMTTKIIWDWACYWGVTALLFFHNNKLFDMAWATSMREELRRFNLLYTGMQRFFQQWADTPPEPWMDEFINILRYPFMHDLYYGLTADLDDQALKLKLIDNLALLESIADECKRFQSLRHMHGAQHFTALGSMMV
ncbi:MAG: tryptophan 7-halogenase, partial [Caldilineaceae bacterium]|nr:tryptophan 7-halogenase [Caldilineaceae bacterium]